MFIGIPLTLFFLKRWLENAIPDIINQEKADLRLEIEEWLNSEKGQKTLYMVGALIAQGAKDSLPFISKGGKFKWQDLIGQIAGKAASKFLGVELPGQEQPQNIKGQISIPEA